MEPPDDDDGANRGDESSDSADTEQHPERSVDNHERTGVKKETAEQSSEPHSYRSQRDTQRRRNQDRSGMSAIRATQSTERRGNTKASGQRKDPVQESFDGERDLYEIARWEVRSPLDRFAVRLTNALEASKRWILLSVVVTLFVSQLAVAAVLILEVPYIGFLAVLSVAPALVLAGSIWYGDPTPREPLFALAVTFLLAIGFATVAGVINSIAIPVFELLGVLGVTIAYFIVVGPIEETVKWLAVRVYAYRTDSFQTVVDGVVYGAMAGVGFAAIENLLYIIMFSVESTTAGFAVQEGNAVAIATRRAFVGPGHVIFSAWAGFYLGLAKFNQGKRGPIVVKGLLIAAFIHALYNTLVTTLPLELTTFVVFLIVFHGFWFALLYRKVNAYRSLYKQRRPSSD